MRLDLIGELAALAVVAVRLEHPMGTLTARSAFRASPGEVGHTSVRLAHLLIVGMRFGQRGANPKRIDKKAHAEHPIFRLWATRLAACTPALNCGNSTRNARRTSSRAP